MDAAPAAAAGSLAVWRERLLGDDTGAGSVAALDPALAQLMAEHDPRPHCVDSDVQVTVQVDPPLARFGAWYELFPRSLGGDRHGTLRDVGRALDRVARMGFDVLYLPPIHPIGETHRKGPNNAPAARPGDPGSPWAIGAADGGHTAVHRELGTVADVRRLAAACAKRGIALALDLAFQCSPDHPWVREHPEWFRHRPDGSIRYAENPPKRYEDIYPLDFESEGWRGLWHELLGVVRFWIGEGVHVFRVDNPHTKPFPFWEWLIGEVKRDHPDVLFLAEAFTRPRVMERLAKVGLQPVVHVLHLAQRQARPRGVPARADPDRRAGVLPPQLLAQHARHPHRADADRRAAHLRRAGGARGHPEPRLRRLRAGVRARRAARPAGRQRGVPRLREVPAAGVGHRVPGVARAPRDGDQHRPPRPRRAAVERAARVPRDRKRHADRLHQAHAPTWPTWCSVVVNLDPHHTQSGWVELPLERLGIDPAHPYQVHDLLDGETYTWQGARNFVEIDPDRLPAHLFHVRRRLRSEHDFEYYA